MKTLKTATHALLDTVLFLFVVFILNIEYK